LISHPLKDKMIITIVFQSVNPLNFCDDHDTCPRLMNHVPNILSLERKRVR
jgi:hypothetical protein